MKIVEAVPVVISGNPNPYRICTLACRTAELHDENADSQTHAINKRFQQKVQNHKAAIALHFAYYNFVKIHQTLRVTPAMEAGISDHVWTISELLAEKVVR